MRVTVTNEKKFKPSSTKLPEKAAFRRPERHVRRAPAFAPLDSLMLRFHQEAEMNLPEEVIYNVKESEAKEAPATSRSAKSQEVYGVNAQGGFSGNAIQAASEGGYSDVIQALLEKVADVNAQGGRYCNALCAAFEKGYQDIVQMLLKNDAYVGSRE
ncbi:hypothetical protein TSTA_022570 [Talaromyces stipitatus ATCC 10500]|uniref:Uncharacterized protein n=1 Tax=Talaromyces stipitatus (strain ATCC 10500 / CBS 375.48 / QM 6759 / NRRL 1006) TaxID=441959 RepID=B8MI41_TALSN|nr:uncharacterized protein TSTA_022570 [Talaromyces stipitatus ATCC 10500]EED17203.1 hypothetical protein TSTA_022570 [Talaromyces stipitatus ATCC 10500]